MNILPWQSVQPANLAQRLEHHEIVTFAPCPIALPAGDDRQFLLSHASAKESQRRAQILTNFAADASFWLAQHLPGYTRNWRPGFPLFQGQEQATRKMWHSERDDLLHIDARRGRPTQGRRILKLCVNLHATEPRVWAKSEPFAAVLESHGRGLGVSGPLTRWVRRWHEQFLTWLDPRREPPSAYDEFMLSLRRVLQESDEFQEKTRRQFAHFPAGSLWLAFTDGFCHADLRGKYLLEQTFLIDPRDLVFPELAPVSLWRGTHKVAAPARAA